jgi:hypothetical protein
MVKSGLAQEVDGYIYVAWINNADKTFNQMVFQPYKTIDHVPKTEENGAIIIMRVPTDSYKLVARYSGQLTGGVAELDAAFKRLTSPLAAQRAVELVKAAKEGRRLSDNFESWDTALKGVQLVARITPILGTTIDALDGKTDEALLSGAGDLSLLVGVGALDKVRKAGTLGRGWKITVGLSTGIQGAAVGQNIGKAVEDLKNEQYLAATAHFGEAGLRLVGITPGMVAFWRAEAKAAARASAAKLTEAEVNAIKQSLKAETQLVGEVESHFIWFDKSPRSQMAATYNTKTGVIQVGRYQVADNIQGHRLSDEFFKELLANARSGGRKVTEIRGIPASSNAEALTHPITGELDPSRIGLTPWAKSLDRLGFTTRFENGVMISTPKVPGK